jgi:hypothetical protein
MIFNEVIMGSLLRRREKMAACGRTAQGTSRVACQKKKKKKMPNASNLRGAVVGVLAAPEKVRVAETNVSSK